ncbi:hypothetical protein CIB48_g2848 [Xylaria polymorpha]|nr:hypothetical protein CIB48_g2848 [Xylaria polymorpha]
MGARRAGWTNPGGYSALETALTKPSIHFAQLPAIFSTAAGPAPNEQRSSAAFPVATGTQLVAAVPSAVVQWCCVLLVPGTGHHLPNCRATTLDTLHLPRNRLAVKVKLHRATPAAERVKSDPAWSSTKVQSGAASRQSSPIRHPSLAGIGTHQDSSLPGLLLTLWCAAVQPRYRSYLTSTRP